MKVPGGLYSPEANLCGSCGPGVSDLVRSLRDLVGVSVTRAFSQDCFVQLVLSVLGITLDSCFFWTNCQKRQRQRIAIEYTKAVFCFVNSVLGSYLTCFQGSLSFIAFLSSVVSAVKQKGTGERKGGWRKQLQIIRVQFFSISLNESV